eukprot:3462669-Rhodomonas_salina.1
MEIELDLDDNGRVQGTSDCGLDFEFNARMCPLKAKDQKKGAGKELLGALAKDCDAIFGSEDSFWLPATMQPRCTMERLAAGLPRIVLAAL